MNLSELIHNLNVESSTGDLSLDVHDISYDSRKVGAGDCFVAISGNSQDGNAFIENAIQNGACAVISENEISDERLSASVVVANAREALSRISSTYFGNPSEKLKLIGITGTNGKTTVTYLIESILRQASFNPGVIGTIGYRYARVKKTASHTTPQSLDLQKLFSDMAAGGVDSCVMEVSSALTQYRVDSCNFDCAVFTNLTPEHLDYHADMDDYFNAKALLFERILEGSSKKDKHAVINVDCPYGMKLREKSHGSCITFGFSEAADVRGGEFTFDSNGIELCVQTPKGNVDIRSKLCGKFNAQNILAAIACSMAIGIDFDSIKKGIEATEFVPGRFQIVPNDRNIVSLVDYAHTPDALENVLTHAREIAEQGGGRLITVFGCGGDRDRAKRPLMGSVVSSKSDVIVVTSDNPRTEKPDSIIGEILPGIIPSSKEFDGEKGYLVLEDRKSAIEKAVSIANAGDVVVVAGKGHEDYQILGTEKIHFDDREVLEKAFAG